MATKRLIDANACPCAKCDRLGSCRPGLCEAFAEWWLASVDAVEVVHGEWVFGELDMCGAPVKCSNCGYGVENADPILWVTYPGHKFCGACGAKMDGDGNA